MKPVAPEDLLLTAAQLRGNGCFPFVNGVLLDREFTTGATSLDAPRLIKTMYNVQSWRIRVALVANDSSCKQRMAPNSVNYFNL